MANQTDDDFRSPFPPETGSALSHQKDQLDLPGQTILSLPEKAADAVEGNNRQAGGDHAEALNSTSRRRS